MTLEQTGPSKVPTSWATASPVPVGWMRQFWYMGQRYDEVQDIPGDVVECGLGEGNTFAMLAYLIGREDRKPSRTLWGFDSFEGWPEPDLSDASPRNPQKGEWTVSEEMVTRRFKESGIYEEFPHLKVTIVKGFLRDTLLVGPLVDFPDRQIAFLHIDVDLYEGYHDALKYLFPKVSKGGLVLFDEYKEFHPELPEYGDQEKWPGCTKAIDDYFRDRPEIIQYHSETKKYYVVKQ